MTAIPLACAALLGAVSFFALTGGGHDVRVVKTLWPRVEALAVLSGFGIDQVTVTGHAFTQDRDVYDAIDLDNVRSFLALDTGAVRARIGRLPWVATADLTRTFPGRLDVRITERKPFAVWRRGGEETLIDRTGRVLARINPGSVPDLPRVAGEGANAQFAVLMGLVARFPGIAGRLESAEWVAERRWTLNLSDGVTLHLPTDREALSLEQLSGELARLVAVPGRTIDLRAPGRIAVRRGAPARVQGQGT